MSIRTILIRIAASSIWVVRRRSLAASDARLLVFTGTSGKTLARSATTFALRATGHNVVSPPYGYTNELGIVLAMLGIESGSLFSIQGIRNVLHSSPRPGAYICVEVGADCRSDIRWLTKRLRPYGVFVTNVSAREWTRPVEKIWADKQELVQHIRSDGFLCYSKENESIERIRSLDVPPSCRAFEFSVRAKGEAFAYESPLGTRSFVTPNADIEPHIEALGSAVAALELTDNHSILREDFFLTYTPLVDRFVRRELSGGAVLISDTYKAVPQCTNYVLGFALSMYAKRRIALVSAMHPLWSHSAEHYERMASQLARFDEAYFMGPRAAYLLVVAHAPRVAYAGNLSSTELAGILRNADEPGTVIVIKTAGRYHMDRLAESLS